MEIKGAILVIKKSRQISENFSVQEMYLDTSFYNQMTGEKYENSALVVVNNRSVDLSQFRRGDIVSVSYWVRGRFYERKNDGTPAFFQSLQVREIRHITNNKGPVRVEEFDLIQAEIPK